MSDESSQNTHNLTGEQAKTKRALFNAIQNGDSIVLDEIKQRLTDGNNNAFTVHILMELAGDLVHQKQADRKSRDELNADNDPICAPI